MTRRKFITLLGGRSGVAARGTRAAAGDAGDRVLISGHPMRLHLLPLHFERASMRSATSTVRMWPSSTDGRRVKSVGCRRWQPNWFAARSP